MQVSAQREFNVDFSGSVGRYFKEKRKDCNSPNSEAFRTDDDRDVVPTGRRWMQFLRGAEKITDGHIDTDGDNEGRVRILELAEELGYRIKYSDDLINEIKEKAKGKYWFALKNAPKDNDSIDGFSIPQKKLIYCKKNIDPELQNFVIAHELSHYLLKHKGMFFYRDTIKKTQEEENGQKTPSNSDTSGGESSANTKILHEKIEYREEADKLAAILLMPYVFMRKYKDKDDKFLEEKFKVPIRAIRKRREEVIKEREKIGFLPSLHTEGVDL